MLSKISFNLNEKSIAEMIYPFILNELSIKPIVITFSLNELCFI